METPIYGALNVMCQIYNRPRISERAALAYIKAIGIPEDDLMQRLLDWLRVNKHFPMPCELMNPAGE